MNADTNRDLAWLQFHHVWQLAPGQLVQLDEARGTRLQVTRGKLWVTLERDQRDIVLEPGASFTIDRGGLTLLEAQGNTKVCVHGERGGLRSRIVRWIRQAIEARWQRVALFSRSVPYY